VSVVVSLVTAASAREREAVITAAIIDADSARANWANPPRHAVLLEGLPDGQAQLESLLADRAIPIIRIAAGCLCCSGSVVLRVNINRLLRHKPHRLFIGIATTTHQAQLRTMLQSPPYDAWLTIGPDIDSCG
jgi:hypothetical protein